MNVFLKIALLCTAIVVNIPRATAAERDGAVFEDSINLDGTALVINGTGTRRVTFLRIKVYVAALYLTRRRMSAEQILISEDPKQLVLAFLHDVEKEDVVDAWNEGLAANAAHPGRYAKELEQLSTFMRDIKNGERMIISFLPRAIRIQLSATETLTIENEDFARAILSIWLGPQPPNGKLKEGLLGTNQE